MAKLKLIILDFDGTIVDTRKANAMAYIATLAEEGIHLTYEEYIERFFGVRCIEFMKALGFNDEQKIAQLRRRKVELYPRYFYSVTLNKPLWGWCQMMRSMGAKLFIVSTGHIDNITNVMRYLNIENDIDGILSGDDVTQPKPHPEGFIKAMEMVGATPAETIIFEDSEVGLKAAEQSGATFVQISM